MGIWSVAAAARTLIVAAPIRKRCCRRHIAAVDGVRVNVIINGLRIVDHVTRIGLARSRRGWSAQYTPKIKKAEAQGCIPALPIATRWFGS
jgi:hypothetical protein